MNTLSFPYADLYKTPKAERPEKRILIVEDDLSAEPLLRKLISELRPAMKVDWATSVPEALILIDRLQQDGKDEKPYDLIISDLNFDGAKSGWDLVQICRARKISTDFVITSGTKPEQLALPFLAKPFRRNTVRECLGSLIEGYQFYRPTPPKKPRANLEEEIRSLEDKRESGLMAFFISVAILWSISLLFKYLPHLPFSSTIIRPNPVSALK